MKDVAARAGVSVKTVSNVVNGYPFIADDTRSRVRAAIEALGYLPNATARTLRVGRSEIIALAVPELQVPYFAELAHHVVQAADTLGLTVLVDETGADPARERLAAQGLRGQIIDGLVFSPLSLDDAQIATYAARLPIVLLGERTAPGVADIVRIDNVAAADDATSYLLDTGRRRIGVLGTQSIAHGRTAQLRQDGWARAHRRRGLEPDPTLTVELSAWHRAEGAAGARALLARADRPDALLCLNDTLALGALAELRQAGLRVPDDIAVVGFDDIEESRFAVPPLTTVATDGALLARTAVQLLVERIADPTGQPPRQVTIPHQLVKRESTAPMCLEPTDGMRRIAVRAPATAPATATRAAGAVDGWDG